MYFDANILTYQFISSAIVVFLLNKAKKAKLPILKWINEDSWHVNRTLAVIASGLVSLGLHWNYSYDGDAGVLTLSLSGLTLASVLEHGREWLLSYVIQQGQYRISQIPKANTPDVVIAAPIVPVPIAPSPETPAPAVHSANR